MASPTYATAEEFRDYIGRKGTVDHEDHTMIENLLSAAEYKIDAFCNRGQDGFIADTAATARVYAGDGTPFCFIDECVEVTAVAVKTGYTESSYSSWASTDWLVATGYPRQADFNRTPYTFVMVDPTGSRTSFTSGKIGQVQSVPTVQITAKWGYAASGSRVLDLVKAATLAQSMRWHARYSSKWADAVAGPEYGTLLYRQDLDPDIKDMLVNGNLCRDPLAEGHAI